MPPNLQIHDERIASYFSDHTENSAIQLASLIKTCSPDSLDAVFNPIFEQLYFHAFKQIGAIDSLLQFLSSVADHIDSSLKHDGETPSAPYGTTYLRPSSGPGLLAERLSCNLYEKQWGLVSRTVTPDDELDRNIDRKYYREAAVYGTILARAFVIRPDLFPNLLWREVEDVLVKGLFTEYPEPEIYVVLAALFLGAGKDIRGYLDLGHFGKGKDWLWYDDVRTKSEDTWSWMDVTKALIDMPIPETVPDYATYAIELAKKVIKEAQGNEVNWDSKMLAHDAFSWV